MELHNIHTFNPLSTSDIYEYQKAIQFCYKYNMLIGSSNAVSIQLVNVRKTQCHTYKKQWRCVNCRNVFGKYDTFGF